jgi:transposase
LKKHTYQAVSVEQVRVSELLGRVMAGCVVSLDVAKTKWLVAIATIAGEVVKLFRFEHPTGTRKFLEVVGELHKGVEGGRVEVVMEATGTYGDVVRHQLVGAGLKVFMVSPKRTHDSKELFDGVPSLHDAKSAVLIARLHAMKLSKEWQPPSVGHVRLRALVDMRQREERREEGCHGWLEASLARHWPELGQSLRLREQKSGLHLLVAYPSPAAAAGAAEKVKLLLQRVSRRQLSDETIDAVVAGASSSLGVPMLPEEERCVQLWATQALDACERQEKLEAEMRGVGEADEVYDLLRRWMGTVTAAVLLTMCNPMKFASAHALEKSAGLNLREKSSGEHSGRLSITKRGPGLVRQMLYLFALRTIHANAVVRAWYERRRGYTEESKMRAVVAVMRKLLRAAFHVARGSAFDASKLFDVRRLGLDSATTAASSATTADVPAAVSSTTTTADVPAAASSATVAHVPAITLPPHVAAGSSDVAQVEPPAVVSERTEGDKTPSVDTSSTQAPMALSELALAAKEALDACAKTPGAPSRMVTKRTTAGPNAREERRTRTTARAST